MSNQRTGHITYQVDADTNQFVSGMNTVDNRLNRLGTNFATADQAAEGFRGTLNKLSAALAAVGAAKALASTAKLIEGYREMAEQVKLNTASYDEYVKVQDRLAKSADNTYRSLSEAQNLYIGTADALRSLGYSTSQVLDINESLSYSMVRNAASVDKGASAISAYTKAVQKGKVDAEAWSTIIAAVPTVVDDMALSTGKSAEEIRKLGAQGKLSAEQLNQGLLAGLEANKAASDSMAISMKDANMQMQNAIAKTLTSLDDQVGATKAVTDGMRMAAEIVRDFGNDTGKMATFLDVASIAAASLAAIIAGRLVGAMGAYVATQYTAIAATLGSVRAEQEAAAATVNRARAALSAAEGSVAELTSLIALNGGLKASADLHNALAAAEGRVVAAQAGLTAAMGASAAAATYSGMAMQALSRTMAFLGGPLGVIMIAATALAYFASQSQATKVDVDNLTQSIEKLTFAQLSKAANDAGDDIEKLNKRLSASMSEMRTQTKRAWETGEEFEKRKTALKAEYDEIQQQIKARRDLIDTISQQKDKLAEQQANPDPVEPGKVKKHETSEQDQKVIDNLKEQRALAQLAGEARARLAAEQKLSADATDEEKKAVGDLAVEIYRLETAKKENIKATKDAAKDAKKDAADEKRHAEQNAQAISDYAVAIGMAAMKGEDLARAQAQAKLNKFATPEDVKVMDDLAKAMYQVQQIEENKRKLAQVDPLAAEAQRYEQELKMLQELNDAKALSDQQYYDLKNAAALAHDEQVRQLEEQAFIRQSEANAFLMRSIDALGQATTNTITGLMSGTMSAQDAMKSFASIILNEAVGSLVQMGIQALKTALIQRSAASAAAAANAAGVSAQVSTQTALAAQAAYASTAAIPMVGPALAPAAATSAAAAAAALGAPAVAASAAGVAGGRLYGGNVAAGSMYKINEDGNPEIFQASNGDQFMMPGTNGQVISNKDINGSGGGMIVNVNINVDSSGESSTSTSGQNGAQDLASQFEAMTLTILEREKGQGGILWNMENDR